MLLDSIRTQLDSLSKSERKVALAVLEHPTQTVSQNITALAKSAQVSEPTVVRFCRTLGYDGWHEFKLKLAQGLALALPGLNEQPAQDDLAADLVENGITMAGGSSLLRGLTTVISNATGLEVRLAEDPLTCVARGTAVYLENLELWKDTMESDEDEM